MGISDILYKKLTNAGKITITPEQLIIIANQVAGQISNSGNVDGGEPDAITGGQTIMDGGTI